MEKKTIINKEPSFIQAINISKEWCKQWEDDLLSDEVLADRISELIKTKSGLRGFFAYTLSDTNCSLLDKLPSSLVFKLRELGENIVDITIKNLCMSTAQVITHKRDENISYAEISEEISNRCINLLKELDTNLVTKLINKVIKDIDMMGNSMDNSIKYDSDQKNLIREKIKEIAN